MYGSDHSEATEVMQEDKEEGEEGIIGQCVHCALVASLVVSQVKGSFLGHKKTVAFELKVLLTLLRLR